jgi:hypothetical protein
LGFASSAGHPANAICELLDNRFELARSVTPGCCSIPDPEKRNQLLERLAQGGQWRARARFRFFHLGHHSAKLMPISRALADAASDAVGFGYAETSSPRSRLGTAPEHSAQSTGRPSKAGLDQDVSY